MNRNRRRAHTADWQEGYRDGLHCYRASSMAFLTRTHHELRQEYNAPTTEVMRVPCHRDYTLGLLAGITRCMVHRMTCDAQLQQRPAGGGGTIFTCTPDGEN